MAQNDIERYLWGIAPAMSLEEFVKAITAYKDKAVEEAINTNHSENLETVFSNLPNGCLLKNPNNYNSVYQCVYKDRSKKAIYATGLTPSEAVIKLSERIEQLENRLKGEKLDE